MIVSEHPQNTLRWLRNPRLGAYYDSFRVAVRGSYLDSVIDQQELLTADYNNDIAGFLNDLHGQASADATVIADALQQTTSVGPLAFMASLQTNGTIDIGEPLQPTLSETVDYDRFFLAEHDIYGSSRIGMRQYLPREYVYEWDVDKSAEDNMISRDSSEFTYRRPWYNNATQSLYGWSGNFRPFIYYTWQGSVYSQRILGQKRYELTNHLGNVMAVVADKVTEVPANTGIPAPSPALKRAALTAVYDYYPFGMLMPSRFYEDESDQMLPITRTAYVMHIHYINIGGTLHPIDTSWDADYNYVVLKSKLDEFGKDYRFGFNGQQKDNELAGTGNFNTASFWEYDIRLGRRWNIDILGKSSNSLYSCFSNSPINRIDPPGNSDYTITRDGEIALAKETEDKNDRLIATNYNLKIRYNKKTGEIKNSYITLDKGILAKKQLVTQYSETKSDNGYILNFGNNVKQAKQAFGFVVRETSVEYSLIQYNQTSDENSENALLTTSQSIDSEPIGSEKLRVISSLKNLKTLEHTHNHPFTGNKHMEDYGKPSNSDGDLGVKKEIQQNFPNAKFHLYDEDNRMYDY